MPSDIFAKLGDIKGESLDDKHKGEIEILSWSWGVTNPGSMDYGSGGGEGKASFQDLTFTHHLDTASPVLWQYSTNGAHLKDGTITQRKAGKGQQEYLVIKLNDIIITSVTHGASGSDRPTETVTIAFGKVTMEYKPQKPDGSLDAGIKWAYDRKLQKEG